MNSPAEQDAPRYVTCQCQYCDGGIEFDGSDFAEGATRTAECPHCHLETALHLPRIPPIQLPPVALAPRRRKWKVLVWIAFGVFGLIIFLVAVNSMMQQLPSDDELRQRLLGTWVAGRRDSENDYFSNRFSFASNGTWQFTDTMVIRGNKIKDTIEEGTWQVKDGVLITTTTKSPLPDDVGIVNRGRILRVDDRELVFRISEGKGTLKREK